MKDAIERLIKRGCLSKYVKKGKKEKEESPKGKSPSKFAEVGTNDEDKKPSKGKRQYIADITIWAPRSNLQYKGKMKRKVFEMMAVHKKDMST